jgi:hypothetical protein
MAAAGGTSTLLAGCSMGGNSVDVEVRNEDTQPHTVEITAVSSEGETLLEKNPQIDPDTEASYENSLPQFDTENPYRVSMTLEDGTSTTVTPEMTEITEVWFVIRSANELSEGTTAP